MAGVGGRYGGDVDERRCFGCVCAWKDTIRLSCIF